MVTTPGLPAVYGCVNYALTYYAKPCYVYAMARRNDDSRNALLPGILDMLVLKTLTLGPLHGYAIARHIEQTSGDRLRIEEGSLYPALQRLQVQGWATSAWETSPTSRRTRVYRLTTAGRRKLSQEASAYDQMVAAVAAVMQAG